jgi:gliding motility-associated-like protein
LIADTLSTKSVNCFGGNDGKITLVVNGGTRPYVYSWNPNVSIDSLGLNLTARPYSITVTDSHGCKDTVNTAINQPTRLSPSVILDSVSCFGGNDGGIIASSTGGTSPYTYAIDGSGTFQSSGTFTGLTAGPHTVTIRDAHSCDSIVSFNIYQPTALSASLIYTRDASCNGTCDGAIRAKGNGGTAPYIFSKDGVTFSSIDSFNALCAGGFTITVKDAKGCTATVPATINQPAVLALDTTSTKQPSCFGAIDGRIVVSATGGTASYLYSIDLGPTQATGTFNGLVAGNHTLTVKDAHNCTKSINVVLGQPALLVADTLSTKSVTCFGGNDGAIKLTVSGGTYPYTYGWTPNVSIDSLGNSLTARPYSILVTDLHGCTSTVNVTISQPTRLSPSIILDSVSCFGGNDGGVTASSTGGTSPYTYAIDGSGTFQSSGTFTGLNAGPHTVTIRDAHSCDSIVAFNIYQPTVLSASILYTRNTSCNGTCDGAIRAKGTGGTAPYTFSSDGVTFSAIDSFVGLCANSFTITVKDANGCTATAPATITQPSALVLDTVSTRPPTCYASSDGQIILTASGGTGSYQYAVDAGSYQASATFNGLSYGPHVGHVKDANGCIANFNVALTQPNPLIADTLSTQNISCFGGSDGVIILSVTGGHYPYTYSWPQIPGKTDSLGSTFAAGTYTPIVTDLTGCFDTVKVTLTQPTKLAPSYTMDSVSCFGAADASVTVTATGGTASYTYDLDAAGAPQASGTFSGLSAGPHTVTVTDAHGCDSIVRFTIYQPTALTTSNPAERDASCNGTCDGMMRGAGSGGTAPYTYSKDGVTFSSVDSFNALCAGNYTVTVKDAKGCTATVNVTVGQPTPLVLDTIGTNPPTCYNGTNGGFVMTASGGTAGYQFSADSGATYQASATFINQSVGPHRVQVKDAHGCITTFTFDVPNTPPSSTFDTVVTNVKCFGGSDGTITLVINGTATPYTFAWSNAATSQNLTGLAIGTYVPTVTDGNGCRVYALNGVNGVDSIKISQPTQIAETHTQTDVSCFGGSNGCITVTPSGGTPNAAAPLYSHSWSNGATTDNPCGLAVGTYTDTITDANGCRFTSAPITINQPSAISATDTFTPVSCPGTADGTATVSASGGTSPYSYLWSSGATGAQATNLTDTTYTVIITDAKGCKDTSSVTVSAINPMQLNAQKKNVFCVPLKNGMINLPVTSGKPPYTFIWDNGSTSPTLTQLGNGTYNVTITDANGCQRDTSFVVITDSSFILTVVPDTATINEGDQIQLASNTRGDGLSSILWSPELSLSCFDCLNPLATPYTTTEYSIHAVSDSGCIADAKSLITVIPQHQVYIPNAFTPNHDGPNDYWEIYGNKKVWVFVEAQVFDRWGEKIFESNDINFQWDGTYKGTPMEPGVYIYTCTIVFLDGKKIDNKGSITLIR